MKRRMGSVGGSRYLVLVLRRGAIVHDGRVVVLVRLHPGLGQG